MRHEVVRVQEARESVITGGFGKKVYDCTGFKRDMKEAIGNFPEFLKIVLFNKEIRRLVKKIMLIVSSVNGCVYCKWFHTKMAIMGGIAPDEVKRLLMAQIDATVENNEIPALLYARNYAETDAAADPEIANAAETFYGARLFRDLTIVIKNVTLANIGGNSFDAFMSAPLSALMGKNTGGLSPWCGVVIFLLGAPIILPIKLFALPHCHAGT